MRPTFAQKFRLKGKETVQKFSVGLHTYRRLLSENYDTELGETVREYDSIPLNAARYAVTARQKDLYTYSERYFTVAVAGLDLFGSDGLDQGLEPQIGDSILLPAPRSTFHNVLGFEGDQYGAVFFLHVNVQPVIVT